MEVSMTRELICIVCPRGCALSCELSESGEVLSVLGNLCPRGKMYAISECTDPQRVVTSTMRCVGGEVVSCKTSSTVPKAKMLDVMKAINTTTAPDSVKIGDVLIENVSGILGINVVATSNK